ncbi:DUF4386 domain-containing protein [Aestuariibacter halophilus]|uniref:DUF4386 domain-containing protein n=1 Tax=Fluctibacter halophilus TaxID=226011 RepID=A0ABS8G8J4_9ALTE|nr:DUF4386 domain-containing protein [Aestuariibacter halophilus]MCC2616870.1 DUF4386 domain-containing protein [Aestuariibacter halophilus]
MTKKNLGRLAGVVYLLVVLTGIFNLIYVPTQLIHWNDAALTLTSIQTSEWLFRAGIVAGILSYVFFALLPLILYNLFKSVDRQWAMLMVFLAVISVPVSLFSIVAKIDILTLLSGASYLDPFTTEQLQTQVMLLLKSYYNGIGVSQLFWGLWLLPFGYLVVRSGYLPKVLGILLMFGCLGYLVFFFQHLLFPHITIPGFVKLPGSIGEIGTCLWLLIMGVKCSDEQQ